MKMRLVRHPMNAFPAAVCRSVFAGVASLLLHPPLAAQVVGDTWTPGAGWALVWADEFTGDSVNRANWNYDLGAGGWGNAELETYTTENAVVADGLLRITALKEPNGAYTSSRLKTQGLQSWTYGKVAARLRLPRGQGIWPAFWMLGDNISTVGWPRCGEIDIMEMIGGGEDRDDSTYGTLHWDQDGHHFTGTSRTELPDPAIFHDAFHVFEVEWTQTAIIWKLDGSEIGRLAIDAATAPAREEFHRPFFIILNLAVGGNWPGSPDASTVFPQAFEVDWVRVYASNATASAPVVTAQPVAASATAGGVVTFSVTVSGQPAPTLQWQKNGVDIAGATSDTLRLSNVTAADAGNYRVIATNASGSATSDAASLTVSTPAPTPPPAPSGGGGGGGAPSLYFPAALLVLAAWRWRRGGSRLADVGRR
jgi:beta-glucanase (GH16 family)